MAKLAFQLPEKLEFLLEPWRYKVAYGGRGGAKSWNFARVLISKALQRQLRILCTREYQTSIKESVHKLICDQIELLGVTDQFEVTQTSIRCTATGAEFIFAGLKNDPQQIKSTESIDIAWVEEGQKVSHNSWEILIPTIRNPDSEIWVSMNPDEEFDPSFVRFISNTPPDARVVKVGYRDNPWFPEVLELERRHLQAVDPEAYQNVWEGFPRRHSEGSYYGSYIAQAYTDGRIGWVPPDPALQTHTFWDLGIRDFMAIWFTQFIGQEIHLINYYEMSDQGLAYYARKLNEIADELTLMYGEHWAPHDIEARELGPGRSRWETARGLGIHFNVVRLHQAKTPDRILLPEGIEAVRGIFHRLWIDEERCALGLRRLKAYRKEWSEKHQCWSDRPVHDDASHGADALRTMAMAMHLGAGATTRMTPDDVDRLMLQYGRRG